MCIGEIGMLILLIFNDVFCVNGEYKPGTVLTQFLPIAYYSTPDYLNNYTDLYLRTAYLDNNLIAHWGAYRKIPTTYAQIGDKND